MDIQIMERKFTIGEKEYSFKMTNRTILKIDSKYGNYANVLQGLMEAKEFYTNSLKLISCCCIEKEWGIDELVDALTSEQMANTSVLATNLYLDYIGVKESDEKNEDNEKN